MPLPRHPHLCGLHIVHVRISLLCNERRPVRDDRGALDDASASAGNRSSDRRTSSANRPRRQSRRPRRLFSRSHLLSPNLARRRSIKGTVISARGSFPSSRRYSITTLQCCDAYFRGHIHPRRVNAQCTRSSCIRWTCRACKKYFSAVVCVPSLLVWVILLFFFFPDTKKRKSG